MPRRSAAAAADTSLSAWSQSAWYQSWASFGPFATIAASNLPSGSGGCLHRSPQTHLTRVSVLSDPGTRPRMRPVIRDRQRSTRRCRPGFPWPFGLPPLASRVILSRRGFEPSSRSADQAAAWTPTGFPRSARVRRDPGGCPLDPGAAVPSPPAPNHGRHPPLPSGQPCTPDLHPIAGGHRNETSSRVHSRSPVRSSPRLWPPDGTRALGLLPGAPHPAVASDARPGGDGPRALGRGYPARHHQTALLPGSPLTTCDLVSHLGDVVGGPDSVQPDSYVLDDRSWSAEDRVRAVAQTQSDFVVLLGLTRRFERLLDRRHHCSRS